MTKLGSILVLDAAQPNKRPSSRFSRQGQRSCVIAALLLRGRQRSERARNLSRWRRIGGSWTNGRNTSPVSSAWFCLCLCIHCYASILFVSEWLVISALFVLLANRVEVEGSAFTCLGVLDLMSDDRTHCPKNTDTLYAFVSPYLK